MGFAVNTRKARKIYINAFGNILEGFEVHHIDHNPYNNEISNLVAIPKKLHNDWHKITDKLSCDFTIKELYDVHSIDFDLPKRVDELIRIKKEINYWYLMR